MNIMRGRESDRSIVIRFKVASRNDARCEVELIGRQLLPPGYVLDDERITSGRGPDNPRPGRKVSVTIVIFQNDTRNPPISFEDLIRRLKVVNEIGS